MRKIYDICINILRIKNSNSCINTKDCEFQYSKGNPLLFTDAVKKRVIAWLVVNPKRLKILSAFSFMSLVTLV